MLRDDLLRTLKTITSMQVVAYCGHSLLAFHAQPVASSVPIFAYDRTYNISLLLCIRELKLITIYNDIC